MKMMQVIIQWTEHNRKYTISLEAFLKSAGIDVTEIQLKQAARHLLEQQEAKPIGDTKYK